jgi:hypothetical protein
VAASILTSLALAIVAPAWMLALGPLIFGVPHVASEVRYLVMRRGLGRGWIASVIAGCAPGAARHTGASGPLRATIAP